MRRHRDRPVSGPIEVSGSAAVSGVSGAIPASGDAAGGPATVSARPGSAAGRGRAVNRRSFVGGLVLGAAGVTVGRLASTGSSGPTGTVAAPGAPTPRAASMPAQAMSMAAPAGPAPGVPLDQRILVLIEFEGGNDGLDTVVPHGDGRYVDLRPTIGLDLSTVLPIDDEVGLNPALAALHASGVAVVEGVGMPEPDLSHFESARRWWQGDMTGRRVDATGFLGRLCDELAGDEPVTGVSISSAASPSLRSRRSVTLSVPDPWAGGWLVWDEDPWVAAARQGLRTFGADRSAAVSPMAELARTGTSRAVDFLDVLAELPEVDADRYPQTSIGHAFATCSRLLAADIGVRVLHVPHGGFDTHTDHRSTHDRLLAELDEALAAFRAELGELQLTERVLMATASEFGRRPGENAGGTDHGTSSAMLLCGPVAAGRHGAAPSLSQLDDDGNPAATVTVADYQATLAESWFGVPASAVLEDPATPIPGIIA